MKELLRKIARKLRGNSGNPKALRHALVGNPAHWKMKRQFQLDFLRSRGLQAQDQLMDLGCGTLRGGIPLIDFLEPGHYTGVDVRIEVIAEARKELEEEGLTHKIPELLSAPYGLKELKLSRKYDVIWAFSVLFHMNNEGFDEALEFISRHLNEGGVCYANLNIGEPRLSRWGDFPLVWREREDVINRAKQFGLTTEFLAELKSLGHHTGEDDQDRQSMIRFSLAANKL